MLSKNQRPYDVSELPPARRLRPNLQDLFASNQISGSRVQEIINDVAAAGNDDFERLRGPLGGNASRNLRRSFLKRSQWPHIYWAQIRVLNLRTDEEELQWCAFQLPHEYLDVLARLGSMDVLRSKTGLDPLTLNHLTFCERQAGGELVALGLWGDGVPVNWDRTESVETLSMRLPGQAGRWKHMRMPLTAVSRKQISEHTWHDIMAVLKWSFTHCAAGTRPTIRHDGSAWRASDSYRSRLVLKSGRLHDGVRASLCEVCGDWKMFGETFGFPKHNTKAGCCWKCTCTPEQVLCSISSFHIVSASLQGGNILECFRMNSYPILL